MLKNPAKATSFYSDSRDNTPLESPLNKGGLGGCVCAFWKKSWLASREGFAVSLVGLFHHICLTDGNNFYN
jgi:hypothetical protein